MMMRMKNGLMILVALVPFAGCSVDLDGFTYDDEEFAAEAAAVGDGDGDAAGDGDNAASEECLEFCADIGGSCQYGSEDFYVDEEECLDECSGFLPAQFTCRRTHLDFAIRDGSTVEDPSFHCWHAALDGGGTCPDATPGTCADFCALTEDACGFGDEGPYADDADCETECEGFTDLALECFTVAALDAADGLAECSETAPDSSCVDL